MPFYSNYGAGDMLNDGRMFIFCGGNDELWTSLTACYMLTPLGSRWIPLKLDKPRTKAKAMALGTDNGTLLIIGGYTGEL